MLGCSASLSFRLHPFHSKAGSCLGSLRKSSAFPSLCTTKNGVSWQALNSQPSSHRCFFTVLCMAAEDNRETEAKAPAQAEAEVDIEALEARLGLGRRARKQQRRVEGMEAGSGDKSEAISRPQKSWEAMTLPEKAWELYVGEKGMLFWLNKLAYTSIFVVVGGWILFRFIGPALGLYQLDSPLLPPDQAFVRP
ncbi:hypothetical protein O6H91_14G016100 [Diphasiastrum complanatum]|nr:hypothetical protein O6H91_14G016100 [Diphasiastrum complanatum]